MSAHRGKADIPPKGRDFRMGLAFKAATTTIPIVTLTSDPVAAGLATNIARPGGNITGTSVDAGLETWGKRIGLLKEAQTSTPLSFDLDQADRAPSRAGHCIQSGFAADVPRPRT